MEITDLEELMANTPNLFGVIYLTTNIKTGKIYVGQQRINTSRSLSYLKEYLGSGQLIQRSIKKHGKNAFKKVYIDTAMDSYELNEKEVKWISFYRSQERAIGYNIQNGGYKLGLSYGLDDRMIWITNEDENLQILESEYPSYMNEGYHKGMNVKGLVCFMNDGKNEYRVYKTEVETLLNSGFVLGRLPIGETVEKVWATCHNRRPIRVGKLSVLHGYNVITDCPICHAANSQDNFCCSDEHWDEFERLRKEAMSKAQSSFVASSWEDESLAAARKAGISNAYAKRRELREAGELDAYVWVKNESLGVQTQVPESDVPEYEESGYVRGRLGFSTEARANMGRDAGFSWSEESLRKREETRQKLHEERMKDPKYVKEQHDLRSVGQLKASEKKKGTWAEKEFSDEWKRMKSETTKAGFAAKKAERLAKGECVTKKWVHRGTESMRVLETEYEAKLTEGWEPGRGKLKGC